MPASAHQGIRSSVTADETTLTRMGREPSACVANTACGPSVAFQRTVCVPTPCAWAVQWTRLTGATAGAEPSWSMRATPRPVCSANVV